MKKIHIIILVVIAISIAAIMGTVADSSTYATFNVAVANEGDESHVNNVHDVYVCLIKPEMESSQ